MSSLTLEQTLSLFLKATGEEEEQVRQMVTLIFDPPWVTADSMKKKKLSIGMSISCMLFVSSLTIPETLREFLELLLIRKD